MNKFATERLILFIGLLKLMSSSPFNAREISNGNKGSPKYRLDYVELNGSRDKLFDYGTIRTRKFNRSTYVINGYFDVLTPFSDEYRFKVDLYPWQGNEYRKQFDRTIINLCSGIRNDTAYMPDIIKQTNVDPNFTCPFQPSRVMLNNIATPDFPIPFMTSDRFRANITIFSPENEIMTKYAVYFVKDV